ncbi:SNF2 family N-terminal domain-containing protein [Mycena crocata]|nr:SNF2 family N-terminal domain-containing protein [Mycena crocata]
MRNASSQHTESLRALPRQYFRPHGMTMKKHPDDEIYRPTLNVSEFVDLLQLPIANATHSSAPNGKGKKRAASPPPQSNDKAQKRAKSSSSSTSGRSKDSSDDAIVAWATMRYPKLETHPQPVPARSIPVLAHTFYINYDSSAPPGAMAGYFATDGLNAEWASDEQNLDEALGHLGGPFCEPHEFDLGTFDLAEHSGRVVVVSEILQKRNGASEWLLLLPELLDELDHECMGVFRGRYERPQNDILVACTGLQEHGRVAINGHLTLIMRPVADAERLPFTLKVEVTVSLTPLIYEPIRLSRSSRTTPIEENQRKLMQYLYPDAILQPGSDTVTNIPFFYSILEPAPRLETPDADRAMQPAALLPTLLPFQRRSVARLLDREGKTVTANGQIVDKPADMSEYSFWERIDEGNQAFYVNRLTGNILPTMPDEPPVRGAILAEEPGLGKTLEMISLLLLNPAPPERHPGVTRWDPEAGVEVKAVKTTLIVTPPALASQWIDELKLHAPSLKVLLYEGWTKVAVPITGSESEKDRVKRIHGATRGKGKAKSNASKKKGKRRKSNSDDDSDLDEDEAGQAIEETLEWCSYVQGFDVVITTYLTLKADINVARAAPKRPRREDVVYSNVERPRSPLILVEWNRVVMDEVQMVGGGNVEDMVSLIPRLGSFAVSGTPARTQISDLIHVLKFLRVDHLVGSPTRHWPRLALPGFSSHFSSFFQNFAIRTTKASVKDELTIPQQTRYLVSIQMGPVERHLYDQEFESALLHLGLDSRGVDVRGADGEPDGALLRSLLRKLRAICTHPQVGQMGGDKLFKPGALKTMEQVLQAMYDNNWIAVIEDCKSKVQGLVRMAQLQQQGVDKNRYQHCLETLLLAEKETKQLIKEIESVIATHEANNPLHQDQEIDAEEEDSNPSPNSKGKGKERERSLSPLSDLESDDEGDPRSPAVKEHRAKRHSLKHRLREFRLVMHRVKFLQGDTYHMLGESQLEAENAAYAEAETIRRSLLKTTEEEAVRAMQQLTDSASRELTAEELQIEVPFLRYALKDDKTNKNKESQEEANEIIENVLNEQSSLLWEWRTRIIDLLTQKLTPGEEADGQEYQRTLDDQGEAETYLINFTSLLADRREALLKERTLLAAHDAREKKLRHTKAAINASAALDVVAEALADIELQPEHEVLHKDLSTKRKNLLQELDGRAIKSVVVEMASRIMLKEAIADLRTLISEQATLQDKLDAHLVLYRKAFNQRILYFRQLQEISDSVSDVVFENTAAQALQQCAGEQTDLGTKINTNRARQRYLDHLAKNKDNTDPDEDEETCILCKCDFIRGCAHVFCEDCMKAWVSKKHRTCPVCRVAIDPDKLERFVVTERPVEPLPVESEPIPKSRRMIEYNMIDPGTFREIQTMPTFGDFGNKIQTLVRHLLYLRNVDAGAKSIVFSAWADSLFIVERALRENGISCLRIDQNQKGLTAVKKFASSDDIEVLLLHGERENAGLNITCASRVFLLESVVHHGFEIQAIARIDRMGQTRPTEVFCYYAEDTVEKNILDLAARHGTSLYTKNNSVGSILNVSTLAGDGEKKAVDSPARKVQKGDFIFKIEDMMAILFPHLFEDIEYLLPAEAVDDGEDVVMADAPSISAVAGPSRLN